MRNINIHINKLKNGETLEIRPKGNSMQPLIQSGQLCIIEPLNKRELNVSDIVYCKVKGNIYLHKISAIKKDQYQISNNKGYVNGWIKINNVFGILKEVK